MSKTVRCIVPALDSNGDPDLYFVKVKCTEEQYENGEHYEAAGQAADEDGYDSGNVIFDEHSIPGQKLAALFDWNTASEVNIIE